jgi:two-component system LytT family response regulator/two-component system response regulator LytT
VSTPPEANATALRTVLVDDEQLAREELGYLLDRAGGVDIVGQAGDGMEALETIGRLQPDLVFLDVQMPGLTGFEVARQMLDDPPSSEIIFVTAYDQYAIAAFEVNAVDYLLKPVDPARLDAALLRARRRIASERRLGSESPAGGGAGSAVAGRDSRPGISQDQLERIVELVAERQGRRERLAIKVGERFLLVPAEEIVYASLSDESIRVVTSQHVGHSSHRTLDELQSQLDPRVFWRVHRSHLVNINQIKEIVPWVSRNYILRMKDDHATEIPVSRSQTKRLREYLKL